MDVFDCSHSREIAAFRGFDVVSNFSYFEIDDDFFSDFFIYIRRRSFKSILEVDFLSFCDESSDLYLLFWLSSNIFMRVEPLLVVNNLSHPPSKHLVDGFLLRRLANVYENYSFLDQSVSEFMIELIRLSGVDDDSSNGAVIDFMRHVFDHIRDRVSAFFSNLLSIVPDDFSFFSYSSDIPVRKRSPCSIYHCSPVHFDRLVIEQIIAYHLFFNSPDILSASRVFFLFRNASYSNFLENLKLCHFLSAGIVSQFEVESRQTSLFFDALRLKNMNFFCDRRFDVDAVLTILSQSHFRIFSLSDLEDDFETILARVFSYLEDFDLFFIRIDDMVMSERIHEFIYNISSISLIPLIVQCQSHDMIDLKRRNPSFLDLSSFFNVSSSS